MLNCPFMMIPVGVAVMGKCSDRVPHPQWFPYHSYETSWLRFGKGRDDELGRPLNDPLADIAGPTPAYTRARLITRSGRAPGRNLRPLQRRPALPHGHSQPARRHRHLLEYRLSREVVRQRKSAGLTIEPELLTHISPLRWAHILLTGEPVAKTSIACQFSPTLII